MSDIADGLSKLSPEELEQIGDLIQKLTQNKEKPVDNQSEIGDNDEVELPQPKVNQQGRSEPRNPVNKRRGKQQDSRRGQGGGSVASRTEPVSLGGVNKFQTMRERNDFKQDSQIDKKLWGNREITQRPEQFEFAEVQCNVCSKWFDIHPNLVLIDQETKEYCFTCDRCTPRGN